MSDLYSDHIQLALLDTAEHFSSKCQVHMWVCARPWSLADLPAGHCSPACFHVCSCTCGILGSLDQACICTEQLLLLSLSGCLVHGPFTVLGLQLLVAPLRKLTSKANATIEQVAPDPTSLVGSIGPYVTGMPPSLGNVR